MLEGKRVSRISVRGIAVASATAVTTVGAVVGMASGSEPTAAAAPQPVADAMTLDSIAGAQQTSAQMASLSQQVETQQAAAEATAKRVAAEAARKKAAAEAARKKAEAEAAAKEKAAKAKAAKIAAVAASTGNYSVAAVQAMAQQIVGNSTQYQCFSWIVSRESGWNYRATNASSGAYGLMQALPGSKMSSAGADWQTQPRHPDQVGPRLHERPLRQPLRRPAVLAGQRLVLTGPPAPRRRRTPARERMGGGFSLRQPRTGVTSSSSPTAGNRDRYTTGRHRAGTWG